MLYVSPPLHVIRKAH
jgi:aspartyl-tRNA synthetase